VVTNFSNADDVEIASANIIDITGQFAAASD